MDIEVVRDLIQLMVDNDLAELEVQDGETRVVLKRQGEPVQSAGVPEAAIKPPGAEPAAPKSPAGEKDEGLVMITSPMVGTFFASPDPESPPYVQVGSEVDPDTAVCVIEAMKVYNEIKAETTGVIERVLVRNEEPVEFGQPLFAVRPASQA